MSNPPSANSKIHEKVQGPQLQLLGAQPHPPTLWVYPFAPTMIFASGKRHGILKAQFLTDLHGKFATLSIQTLKWQLFWIFVQLDKFEFYPTKNQAGTWFFLVISSISGDQILQNHPHPKKPWRKWTKTPWNAWHWCLVRILPWLLRLINDPFFLV